MKLFKQITIFIIIACVLGCKKNIAVDVPATSITNTSVFQYDATAISALTSLYTKLSSTSFYSGNSGFMTLSGYAGLSSDELTLFDLSEPKYLAYYRNDLTSSSYGFEYWETIYPLIFTCNSAIEGLDNNTSLAPQIRNQLLGEAKFMRGFFYFYLTNLFGDVPLVLSTDFKVNASLPRASKNKVFEQIITDLNSAKDLLSSNYLSGALLTTSNDRVRPAKWAAVAMLARAYLYSGDWANAEAQSTSLINNPMFSLSALNNVFQKASLGNKEAIWQLQPVMSNITNTQDAYFFIIPDTGPSSTWPVYLSDNLLNAFETNDNRKNVWINSVTVSNQTYYYPYKYKVNSSNATVSEHLMMLRLGEQYLIRAEARARQNNLQGAIDDVNYIRLQHGGLTSPLPTPANQTAALDLILHERQVELFTELGQRWFDLKRTNSIDAVMSIATAQKGGTWKPTSQLFPIPLTEIKRDINLTQNAGY